MSVLESYLVANAVSQGVVGVDLPTFMGLSNTFPGGTNSSSAPPIGGAANSSSSSSRTSRTSRFSVSSLLTGLGAPLCAGLCQLALLSNPVILPVIER